VKLGQPALAFFQAAITDYELVSVGLSSCETVIEGLMKGATESIGWEVSVRMGENVASDYLIFVRSAIADMFGDQFGRRSSKLVMSETENRKCHEFNIHGR
jgi:hypothetical protein